MRLVLVIACLVISCSKGSDAKRETVRSAAPVGTPTGSASASAPHRFSYTPPTQRPVIVQGELSSDEVQAAMAKVLDALRACARGATVLRFVIDADGKAKDVNVAGPSQKACVMNALGALVFPKPKKGVVSVSYPIDPKSSP